MSITRRVLYLIVTIFSGSPKTFAENHTVWHEFDFKVFPYILSNEGILPITHNMQKKYFCNRKKDLGTSKVINSHKKKFIVAGRIFLFQEELSCHRKKFLVIGRNILSDA